MLLGYPWADSHHSVHCLKAGAYVSVALLCLDGSFLFILLADRQTG